MKINWFSPLLPAKTDIAHYTMRVTPELSKLSDVTVWTNHPKWDPVIEEFARVRLFEPRSIDIRELNRADATFFHLGNNADFHGSIWEVALIQPGISVLHDYRFHHFFVEHFCSIGNRPERYFSEIEHMYGAAGRGDAENLLRRRLQGIDTIAETYPMTPLAVRNSVAAIVHSKETFDLMKSSLDIPVAYAPLPFACRTTQEPPNNYLDRTDKRRLIIFGYLAPNRRLEEILKAIAQMPDTSRFELSIYGEIWDRSLIEAQIQKLGLGKTVRIHGFVPEAELDRAIESSDLALNLRNPSMGEASGSQLRCWANGVPSMVSRTGWYAGLPEDIVIFVRPENEIEDIQTHLHSLLDSLETFRMMGERGKAFLEREHSPHSYARTLIGIAERMEVYRAHAGLRVLANRTGDAVSNFASVSALETISQRAAEQIVALNSTKK